MCRNIKTLFNFEPPATDEEIRAASLQFVRKLSGFNAPSKANEAAFNRAIDEVFVSARNLIDELTRRGSAEGAGPRGRTLRARFVNDEARVHQENRRSEDQENSFLLTF
jgi:hypothetical protein